MIMFSSTVAMEQIQGCCGEVEPRENHGDEVGRETRGELFVCMF